MNGASSNDVRHTSSHGPFSDIRNVPCSHLLGFAPHLLTCYVTNMWSVLCTKFANVCYAPYPYQQVYYAPYPYLKMCYTLDLDLQMCYALNLRMCIVTKSMDLNLLLRATISYKQCMLSSGLPL